MIKTYDFLYLKKKKVLRYKQGEKENRKKMQEIRYLLFWLEG